MWPQKWKPSASPGRTALATTPPASSPPTRAISPRRDVPFASDSVNAPMSGMRGLQRAALGGGQHALELREAVEGALGQHGAGTRVQRDGERAARDLGERPHLGVA